MPDDQQFGPQYLQALLRSNPGSTEELEQARQKIELYFRRKEEAHKNQLPKQTQKPVQHRQVHIASPLLERSLNRFGVAHPRRLNRYHLAGICIVILAVFSAVLTVWGTEGFLPICLIALLPVPFWVWGVLNRYKADPKPDRLGRANMQESDSDHRAGPGLSSDRHLGQPGDSPSREKWIEFEKLIGEILQSNQLESSFGPAEECLAILNYFDHHKNPHHGGHDPKTQLRGTQIDPLNTLIERLIEDHQWEWADRLSQLYLKLLAPDI